MPRQVFRHGEADYEQSSVESTVEEAGWSGTMLPERPQPGMNRSSPRTRSPKGKGHGFDLAIADTKAMIDDFDHRKEHHDH